MRLPAIQTIDQRYTLVGLDLSEHMANMVGLDLAEHSHGQLLAQIEVMMAEILAPEVSGLVIDHRYGFDSLTRLAQRSQESHTPGVILPLTENANEATKMFAPKLLPGWGVEQVQNNYGLALIRLWFNAAEEKALEKKQFLAEIYDFCHYQGIDLMVELKLIGHHGGGVPPEEWEETQLAAVQELRTTVDLLAVEYPGSVLAAATLTAELDIPWILTSSADTYPTFKSHLRDALESGAQGFLLNEALWREIEGLRREDMSPDLTAIEHFFKTTGRDRLIELSRIVQETRIG